MNVVDDAAAYLLCALMCGCCCGLRAERVVEPHLLDLESLLNLVQLVEAGLMSLTVMLILHVDSPSAELSSELSEWTASGY
jgi:hypothetical protein